MTAASPTSMTEHLIRRCLLRRSHACHYQRSWLPTP